MKSFFVAQSNDFGQTFSANYDHDSFDDRNISLLTVSRLVIIYDYLQTPMLQKAELSARSRSW